MRVVLSHRIALVPTATQEPLLRQAVGVSRFAYNWALAKWKRQYQAGEKPSEVALRRRLNSIKRQQFPWKRLVPAPLRLALFYYRLLIDPGARLTGNCDR